MQKSPETTCIGIQEALFSRSNSQVNHIGSKIHNDRLMWFEQNWLVHNVIMLNLVYLRQNNNPIEILDVQSEI